MAHGWHFFMNPGPTNIPDRILRAMDRGTMDFTGAQFRAISDECFAGLKRVFKTEQTILAYAASGHGAWEAALVNLFSPGDKVLLVESGFFSLNWGMRGEAFGLEVETLPNDWRRTADPAKLEARLRADTGHQIKAVLAVHNETSTGVAHPIAEMRRAIDAAGHPALYLVDTISSLASFDFRMDEWGVDVGLLGLAAADGRRIAGLLERHCAGALLLRAAGSAAHARRGRARQCLRPPPPARRGNPTGGARVAAE